MVFGITIFQNCKTLIYVPSAKTQPWKWKSKSCSWLLGFLKYVLKYKNECIFFFHIILEPSGCHLLILMSRGTFLFSLRRLLSPVSHSKLIIHKLFYPYLCLLPNPPTFIHIRPFFSPSVYGPVSAVAFQVARIHFVLHISRIYKWRHAREGDQTLGEDAF